MKENQGEFQQLFLACLVLLLHRIAVFGDAEIPCNRTCGSRTVKYPFGFSGTCPYILDSNCSESGAIYLKGFQVLDFTNSSIIIRPWQSGNNKPKCYEDADILSVFRPQFGLTNRNILLLENCTNPDCKFDIADFRHVGSNYYDGRENCTNIGLNNCLSNTDGSWLAWKSLDASTCRHFVSSFLYLTTTFNGSITLDVDKLELAWWVNGTCLPSSCSAHAKCSQFQNPNNNNETVNRCYGAVAEKNR